MLRIEQQNGKLFIFEDVKDYYEEIDEFPIVIPIEEAYGTVEIPGVGKNVSLLLYELSSLPWIGKQELHQVMNYLKQHFLYSRISWDETYKYFGDLL